MRTKIGLLSILMTVLLAFGGTAIAQDYDEPQDPALQENELQEPMEEPVTDVDVDVDAEADLQATTDDDEFATDDEFADDEFATDDELPQTASFLPVLGALGLLSLAGGAALRGRK